MIPSLLTFERIMVDSNGYERHFVNLMDHSLT